MLSVLGGAWHPHFFCAHRPVVNRRLAFGLGLSAAIHALLLFLTVSPLPRSEAGSHDRPIGKFIARLAPATARGALGRPEVFVTAASSIKRTSFSAKASKPGAFRTLVATPSPPHAIARRSDDVRVATAVPNEPPAADNEPVQRPTGLFTLPRIAFGAQGHRPVDAPRPTPPSQAYYAQMMAMEAELTRAAQLQQLASRLTQLSGDWLHPGADLEGRCWLGTKDGATFSCEPSELRDLFASRERELMNILQATRSLGRPATGVSIAYRDGRYSASVLIDEAR
jgi:hypothetical protein